MTTYFERGSRETKPREVAIEPQDPVDCIFVVAELLFLEDRHLEYGREERAARCRRVREALERAVYGSVR
jgi:hypothetical protein